MKQLFDLHPAAIAGRYLAGNPIPGPARRDAEPEPEEQVASPSLRGRALAALARRRRREPAVAPGR